LGALFGGAFGHAAKLLLQDPRIDPGAFALVGMGCFYGGIAHVPISALILVSELAGSYDLLVPLMLAVGIAFVALRKDSLYEAQPATRKDSPAHRGAGKTVILKTVRVVDVAVLGKPFVWFELTTPAREVLPRINAAEKQTVFPVLDPSGRVNGVITFDTARTLSTHQDAQPFTMAADLMQPPISVGPEADLLVVVNLMFSNSVREVIVADHESRVLGFIDESDIFKAYIAASSEAELSTTRGESTGSIPAMPADHPDPGTFTELRVAASRWSDYIKNRIRNLRRT
jgi:CIC family chloride channel protein